MQHFDPLDPQGAYSPPTEAPQNVLLPKDSAEIFQSTLGTVEAGQSVNAKTVFPLKHDTLQRAGIVFDGSTPPKFQVDWQLIDDAGTIYSQGYAHEIRVTAGSVFSSIEALAVVVVPSGLPPTSIGYRYQLLWTLSGPAKTAWQNIPFTSVENISVTSPYTQTDLGYGGANLTYGPANSVEQTGTNATLSLILDHLPDSSNPVTASLYRDNTLLQTVTADSTPKTYQGFNGYQFNCEFASQSAALDAYTVVWSWKRQSRNQIANAQVFWVTPSILSAMSSITSMVAKAGGYTIGHPDAIFDDISILNWLQRGRDVFNAATGRITYFTMINASGPLREFWIRYAEVGALRAQALAESEKAFNFSSGATSLDVDKAAAYESAASAIESRLDSDIGPFKQNLLIKGITGGDGNVNNMNRAPQLAVLGVSLTPASQSRFRLYRR